MVGTCRVPGTRQRDRNSNAEYWSIGRSDMIGLLQGPQSRNGDKLLRGAIVNKTYGVHNKLYIFTIFTNNICS